MSGDRAILALAAAGALLLLALGAAVTGTWGALLALAVLALAGAGLLVRRPAPVPARPVPAPRPPPGGTAAPLLDQLRALTPDQFEEFTRLLFEASGTYRAIRRTGGSGDGGIDLTMRDGAGNLCVVQCKRYRGSVSPAVVRDLYGVMARHGAREAYLITTGRVSPAAQAWVGTQRLHVWGGDRLVRYARQYLGAHCDTALTAARGGGRAEGRRGGPPS